MVLCVPLLLLSPAVKHPKLYKFNKIGPAIPPGGPLTHPTLMLFQYCLAQGTTDLAQPDPAIL